MTIAICDDEITTRKYVTDILMEKYQSNVELFSFSNAEELNNCTKKIDVLISDIVLENENGIDVAKKYLKHSSTTKVIFMTGFPYEYYEKIFEGIRPYGYLGKPIREEVLYRYIDELLCFGSQNQMIELKSKGTTINLPVNQILYIESNGRKKDIVTLTSTQTVNISFDKIKEHLTEDFVQCHEAYCVNLCYVSSMLSLEFELKNGKHIPISRANKAEVKSKYYFFKEKQSERNNF